MPYATFANEDNRTGMMIVLPGIDHAHEKGKTSCMICVSNQKQIMSNNIWLFSRRAARALNARISLGMIRLFDYAGKSPPKKLTHSEQRDLERLVKLAKKQRTTL